MQSEQTLRETIQSYRQALRGYLLDLIAKIKQSPYNENIYAFIIDVRIHHYYCVVGVNNLAGYQSFTESESHSAADLLGFSGRKFNVDDFSIRAEGNDELGEFSALFNELCRDYFDVSEDADAGTDERETAERLLTLLPDLYLEAHVEVLKEVSAELRTMNTVDDFVAFVAASWDLDEAQSVALAKQTIADDLFDKVFPPSQVVTTEEQDLSDLDALLRKITDHYLYTGSDRAILHADLVCKYESALADARPQIDDALIGVISDLLAEVKNKSKNQDEPYFINLFEKEGAFLSAICGLFFANPVPRQATEQRLLGLLSLICAEPYRSTGHTMSIAPSLIADVLYTLNAERFPVSDSCITTFYLQNYKAYLS
ncbi:hypothetical protein HCH_05552 [Hahella chejuensis KCTC 2396]|uniref:Uncharacterized protein n=1 Tax=Hahella chejuensis (strain KCTC 2396) TaxID=349521 RepID=Q2SAW2_HAHCH|nr:hypothetical protein [Hahella chejuensis]ABC32212.1 hypothetical protein HCH_05552 [Hahella chejuensis KCTC 2396]